jgi:TonB family protein
LRLLVLPVLLLTVLLPLGMPPAARADDGKTLVTRASLLIGFPSGEASTAGGVLVVPGTVIPAVGEKTWIASAPREEDHAAQLARTADNLTATFRLTEVQVSYSEIHPVPLGGTVELSPPTRSSSLRISVGLLGLDERTATYQVRFLDAGTVIADSRVAAARGRQTVIGGLDGEEAPYVFLVLEPFPPEGGPVKVEEGITAPRRLDWVMPRYTEEARKERIQGVVIVQTVIDRTGAVSDARVLKGLPKGLSEAAVDAIRQWRFEPATNADGEPVEVYYNLTVNFRLDEEKKSDGGAGPETPQQGGRG